MRRLSVRHQKAGLGVSLRQEKNGFILNVFNNDEGEINEDGRLIEPKPLAHEGTFVFYTWEEVINHLTKLKPPVITKKRKVVKIARSRR